MDTIPFTNKQSIVKVCVVWMLGLAMLLGSSGVSFAIPKIRPGKSYCDCSCQTFSKGVELIWEKVASCNLNGKKCKGTNSAGVQEDGILQHCQQCTGDASGSISNCNTAANQFGGVSPPVRPGVVEPGPSTPPTAPFSKQDMNASKLQYRGVEGEGAGSAPAGQETAPAPK
jgi:hypothetical protein